MEKSIYSRDYGLLLRTSAARGKPPERDALGSKRSCHRHDEMRPRSAAGGKTAIVPDTTTHDAPRWTSSRSTASAPPSKPTTRLIPRTLKGPPKVAMGESRRAGSTPPENVPRVSPRPHEGSQKCRANNTARAANRPLFPIEKGSNAMSPNDADVSGLVLEYSFLLHKSRGARARANWKRVQALLVEDADWTKSGAQHVVLP